jgi:hypothetical protein
MKEKTTLLIDSSLKKAAKSQKFSLSATLEEALRIKLALPTQEKEEIASKIEGLKSELAYLQSASCKKEREELEKLKAKERLNKAKDIEILKRIRVKWLQNSNIDYNIAIKVFCFKYGIDRGEAVALAEARK